MSRRPAEFPSHVHEAIKSRNVCEECGGGFDPEDPWRVHHILWIEWGERNCIPLEVLKSIANGSLLHDSCHKHLHNRQDEPSPQEVKKVLSEYNGMKKQTRMFLDRQFERPRRIV